MSNKRELSDDEDELEEKRSNRSNKEDNDEPIKRSNKKKLDFEHLYLSQLPSSECYEKSYMHKENVTHVISATKTDFIITGSIDGAIKFWKKQPIGIEFVKHFRAHRDKLIDLTCNCTDKLLASTSLDKTVKVFDVVNFDMINVIKIKFIPFKCIWIHSHGDPIQAIAVSDSETPKIFIFDSIGRSSPIKVFDNLHMSPVSAIKYNPVYSTIVSIDSAGFVEHWSSPKYEFKFPDKKRISFDSKFNTDLFEFVKNKLIVHDICFSTDGQLQVTASNDRKIRIFKYLTGKIIRVYDESLQHCSNLQQTEQIVPNMEFGRRMAIERDLEKVDQLKNERLTFDQSGYFLFYPSMFGVKMVNWYTNKCIRIIGKSENIRPLSIALYQNSSSTQIKGTITLEMAAANNPNLENILSDPTLFTNAYKRNRFYMFSRRDPEESANDDGESNVIERDIVNEKISSKDLLTTNELNSNVRKIYEECCIHTSMGDIHLKLFGNECPKTVENFCVHSKNGYYNGHIFHRIIKSFMIQTGDPTGTGTGGESIWGKDFEDEFHPELKHNLPYTMSMANAGPNTNGSQFFITVAPSAWLDNKHTVFGRVIKGMEIVQNISKVKTNPKTDKPYDEIKIINISLKS